MPSLPKIKQIKLPDGNTYDLDVSNSIILIETLLANATSVTFTDSSITSNKRYNLYVEDKPLLKPTGISINGNSLTVTFPAQTTDTRVKLVINEDEGTPSV